MARIGSLTVLSGKVNAAPTASGNRASSGTPVTRVNGFVFTTSMFRSFAVDSRLLAAATLAKFVACGTSKSIFF